MPTLLAAKPVLDAHHPRLKKRVEAVTKLRGRPPKLSVILVGDDPASQIYVSQKGKRAIELGMQHETILMPATSTPQEVRSKVASLNQDPSVDGILIQRPLPRDFREEELVYWVNPRKDVDAFHPENTGRMILGLPSFAPCTPSGVMKLLEHYGVELSGRIACVVGRSSIVGKPMAHLLLQADATVLHTHSKTRDLASITRQADLLIVAAGKPGLIGKEHIKPGAIVIDVGVHRLKDGKVVGDVNFDEVQAIVSAITPVPGGVGPMTILQLMENTVISAETMET